jgi:hypothetical protein
MHKEEDRAPQTNVCLIADALSQKQCLFRESIGFEFSKDYSLGKNWKQGLLYD